MLEAYGVLGQKPSPRLRLLFSSRKQVLASSAFFLSQKVVHPPTFFVSKCGASSTFMSQKVAHLFVPLLPSCPHLLSVVNPLSRGVSVCMGPLLDAF